MALDRMGWEWGVGGGAGTRDAASMLRWQRRIQGNPSPWRPPKHTIADAGPALLFTRN